MLMIEGFLVLGKQSVYFRKLYYICMECVYHIMLHIIDSIHDI